MWRSFFDRYFPRPSGESAAATPVSDAREFEGSYQSTRRFDLSILKLNSLTSQVRVSANPDGTIKSDLVNELGRPKTLHEVAPMKFCDEKGEDCIAFHRDQAGKLLMIGDFPHTIYQQVPWYEERTPDFVVLFASGVVFALTLALWPIGAITRRHYGRKLDLTTAQRRRRLLVRIVCVVNLAFLIGGRMLMLKLPNASLDIWVHLLQVVGIAGALGTLIVIYDSIRCWSDPGRWWLSKVGSVLVGVAGVGYVAFALIWNLFDFSTRY